MAAYDCDVVILGGGPAGLSAALVLGRARRRVVLFDSGEYRNAASGGLHGFITRDGIHPSELRWLARAELSRYDGVVIRDDTVLDARRIDRGFDVRPGSGNRVTCRKLVFATGLIDTLPDIKGAVEL